MAKPRNDFLDRLTYFALRVISMLLHWWPVNLNLCTARLIAFIWHHLDRSHRVRAIANLHNSFPELSEAECDRIACRSVQHLFMLGVEVLFTPRLLRIDTWRKYVDLGDFKQTLGLLMDPKRGVILLTGHYGNWEILGFVLATLGFETTSVVRPLDNPYINDWLFGVRGARGQKLVHKKGATDEVSTRLEEGGAIALVADQNAGSKGIFVDFFGRKASAYKSIGLLAMQYEVPVVIGFARRMDNKFRFLVTVGKIIWPADWQKESDPLRYITQQYTSAIEDMVRGDPGQYLWAHRRWKTRPKGEIAMKYD